MIRTFKYRLYPTRTQERDLKQTLHLTRTLYNAGLEQRISAYRKQGKTITSYDQQRELTALKEECPEFNGVYSHVLQDALDRLDMAYQGFFRRVKRGEKAGFPRFKPAQRWNSFKFKEIWDRKRGQWKAPGKPTPDGRRINLPKIGQVKIKFHRPLTGTPKTLHILLDVDQWYAIYTCEVQDAPLPPTGQHVGLDMGTTRFATTSTGAVVENPRHLNCTLAKLRVQQRTVNRRQKGSGRRRQAVRHVAKTHRRIRRQRLDFHHKTARTLVQTHDLIAIEDLQTGNMVRSNLARSISDAGWSQFFNILSLKAESAGRKVIRVDPRFTSQTCHQCGHTCRENRRSQAVFRCVGCGWEGNADHNAAINILGRAVPSGMNAEQLAHASPEKPLPSGMG